MMSSFDSCQVLLSLNFACEPSLEIQKYRLLSGRIYEMVKKFGRMCRRQEEKLGGWEILGRCCLRRMECGRILGHMRFEALKSRSSRLWMRTHRRRVFICPAAGGGYITFLVLLKRKLDAFKTIQNRQISIKIHSKPFKIDKNPL